MYMGVLPRSWDEIPARVIVNACGVLPTGNAAGRLVFLLPLLDIVEPDVVPPRRVIETFLQGVHAVAHREPSYWHCHAGLNRSGLLAAAYLHLHRHMRIGTAIGWLRKHRSRMVLCNPLFERTLREWYGDSDEQAFEPILFTPDQQLKLDLPDAEPSDADR